MATEQQLVERPKSEMDQMRKEAQYYRPAVDVSETKEELILRYDMPGVHKDNVGIMVEKDTLCVTGKADPEESGTPAYREARVGDYRREFTLPEDVDTEHVEAKMDAGVVTIKINKRAQAKPRRIEISGKS
jgi:HSP20 family protein